MHLNILTEKQLALLPTAKVFSKIFYLAGGTAIALHLGHRRSIDLDLFTHKKLNKNNIRMELKKFPLEQTVIFEDYDQIHLMVNQVKLTFLSYPYQVLCPAIAYDSIHMPTLLSLAAMKAFALGRRAKWKDYVDMFFIIRDHYSITEICTEAQSIFGDQFSSKLFREQLAFHKDIDYSESVEFCIDPVSDDNIKTFLIDKATDVF